MKQLFLIFFAAMLVNNILLIRFLGLCSFFGISQTIENSLSMGFAVMFVMTMATLVTWPLYHYLLKPFNLIYLRTLTFVLIIASLVQFVEMFMKKTAPTLYHALGIFLPLITTNCAILAATFLTIDYGYSLVQTLIYSLGVSAGYIFAITIFSSLRQKVNHAPIPRFFKGYPIAFILAGLLSLSFLGFVGMFGLQL